MASAQFALLTATTAALDPVTLPASALTTPLNQLPLTSLAGRSSALTAADLTNTADLTNALTGPQVIGPAAADRFTPIAFNNQLYFFTPSSLAVTDGAQTRNLAELQVYNSRFYSPLTELLGESAIFKDKLYFVATTSVGRELWSTDGTVTNLVADINPGVASSRPSDLIVWDDKLYFTAATRDAGSQLWATDGVTLSVVFDYNPGPIDYPIAFRQFTVFNDKLYFTVFDPQSGTELWATDGITTAQVADIAPGPSSSDPTNLTVFNDKLYFRATASGAASDAALWATDGTTTTLATNFAATDRIADPNSLTVFGNQFYFSATIDGARNLWVTDGITTSAVVDRAAGAAFSDSINRLVSFGGQSVFTTSTSSTFGRPITTPLTLNGQLYFVTDLLNSTNVLTGRRLWAVDGATIAQVTDLPLNSSPLTVFDGKFYFANTDSNGRELWVTDGVTTNLVIDINPGIADSAPSNLMVFNDRLYFTATDGNGRQLWSIDGSDLLPTPSRQDRFDVSQVADLRAGSANSNVSSFVPLNDSLYFAADNGINGRELWVIDGTVTNLVADINPGASSSNPSVPLSPSSPTNSIASLNGKLYFDATSGINGRGLWTTDGVTTALVADIDPLGYNPTELTSFNGNLYFNANTTVSGIFGRKLWVTDGTTTRLFADDLFVVNSDPTNLTVLNDKLYFTAIGPGIGRELWSTDGTTTALVRDFSTGISSSNFTNFRVFNDKLYFVVNGNALWSTDGTTLNQITPSGQLAYFTIPANSGVNDQLYFTALDGSAGVELWSTDGTTAYRVADIAAGSNGSSPSRLTVFNNQLYFTAAGAAGRELWVTDGTTTTLLADIALGLSSSDPDHLQVFGDKLYFAATDGNGDRELWATDGTTTARVADINPGFSSPSLSNIPGFRSSNPSNLTVFGDTLFFTAFEANSGLELWAFDGTDTFRVTDIAPGVLSSAPSDLRVVGDRLYFLAADSSSGRELWSLSRR